MARLGLGLNRARVWFLALFDQLPIIRDKVVAGVDDALHAYKLFVLPLIVSGLRKETRRG